MQNCTGLLHVKCPTVVLAGEGQFVKKAPLVNISINTLILEEDVIVIKNNKCKHTIMTIDFVFANSYLSSV